MTSPSVESFSDLPLSPQTLKSLESEGFTKPTPIQAQAIPLAITGVDMIGCAATGTGKTAAFALPLIERLAGKTGVRGLVLAPTRELAVQIAEQFERFGKGRGLKIATLIGGVGMGGQIQAIRRGATVIVATPGRLIDHLDERTVRLDDVEALVLDEADRMLDMGFKPQLTRILAKVPKTRQTLLFSATMAGEVADFARVNLKNPAKVEVAKSGTTAARASQSVYLLEPTEKTAMLLSLLQEDQDTTLVFTRTKRRADKVARSLEKYGHTVARIHADRSQSQRQQALKGFKDGTYRVLVATDIAARGIDVEEIGHVVNYDLPHVPADYVHRIGRTARNAASGKASSFTSPEEQPLLRDIEKFTRTLVPRGVVPRDAALFREESERAFANKQEAMEQESRGGGHRGRGRHDRSRAPQRSNNSPGPRNASPRPASSGGGAGGPAARTSSGGGRPSGGGQRRSGPTSVSARPSTPRPAGPRFQ